MAKFVGFDPDTGQAFTGFACSRGRSSGPRNSSISVTAESGGLKVKTPYNADFVSRLKIEIPTTGRSWDAPSKCWLVSPQYADKLKMLIDAAYGGDVQMPTVIAPAPEVFEITFQADYIGSCRDGNAASVHSGGSWSAKIPEKVLRSWFKQVDTSAPATYYGLLGVDQKALAIDIKKAYKRAARQWHPDICKEPEAREMFEKCKEAFDILNDPMRRARYNAGLMFEAQAKSFGRGGARFASKYFIPMFRCGMLRVKATRELNSLIVQEILEWNDIENQFGQVMISYWAGDAHAIAWV